MRYTTSALEVGVLCLFVGVALFSADGPSPLPAHAANLAVTRSDDPTPDGCSPTDCSLREAVVAANATYDADTIVLSAGTYTLTIPGTDEDAGATGDLDITAPLTITGAGETSTIIDGGSLDRVFDVYEARNPELVSITGLTVSNGVSDEGGGIRNFANLALTDLVVKDNTAQGRGGGIINYGEPPVEGGLVLTDSTVTTNQATHGGGVANFGSLGVTRVNISTNTAQAEGGGVWHGSGDFVLSASVVSSNTAILGGGIWTAVGEAIAGTFVVERTTISGNTAGQQGGGIFFEEGAATLTQSTINHNAAVAGGGIWGAGAEITLTNTTLSGNTATEDGGGLAYCYCRFRNVTIADNTADSDGNGSGDGGGVIIGHEEVHNACCAESRNTIMARNTDVGGEAPNLMCDGGTLFSEGHNLIQDIHVAPPEVTGCTVTGDVTGNIVGQGASLGPLAANGGLTETHALLPGSPAIDAGNPQAPGSGGYSCEVMDQRGVSRPQRSACDIGSFESSAPVGGIAELPDVAESVGGSSSLPFSVPTGLLAAGAMILMAGGWYARRRWFH